MSNIFIGFIFTFLDFNINIGPITLGIIPDFVGYIFIVNGLNDLRDESSHFMKAKPWAIAMAIYAAIQYIMDIFGIAYYIDLFVNIMGVMCYIVDIYIVAMIIKGVKEMEVNDYADYEIDKVKGIWIAKIVIEAIAMAIAWMAIAGGMLVLASLEIPIIIAALVINIIFLVRFNHSKKLVEFAKPILEAKKRLENQKQ